PIPTATRGPGGDDRTGDQRPNGGAEQVTPVSQVLAALSDPSQDCISHDALDSETAYRPIPGGVGDRGAVAAVRVPVRPGFPHLRRIPGFTWSGPDRKQLHPAYPNQA